MSNTPVSVKFLETSNSAFDHELDRALARDIFVSESVVESVAGIIRSVRQAGDKALVEYTGKFDNRDVSSVSELIVSRDQLEDALRSISVSDREALQIASERIRKYHEKQKQPSWQYREEDGSVYGQKISPLRRAGVYVPGGKANYPSSMLMLAIPAQVAGVPEIIATVPTAYSTIGDASLVFAAAALSGVSQVFTIGGAQAIAAMAYGTESVPRVDKITGPGNIYVTEAKRQVFGQVGIDMLAGPSELTVICDGETDPDWIAMDLFSQAEHDEQAQAILISADRSYFEKVMNSINRLLPEMERQEIIRKSLEGRGIFIHVESLEQAVEVSNRIAPEHLELSVAEPELLLDDIDNAGAVFLGRHTAEALGDYCAGPSHVLPTAGSARFFSPLGVYDFQKRSSIVNCSAAGADKIGITAAILARKEGLQAHALSAEYRITKKS